LDLVDIAGHQLDASIFEALAAVIADRYPANEIKFLTIVYSYKIVVGFPTETCGNIAKFGIELARFAGLQFSI
jgi:hypothetical protein